MMMNKIFVFQRIVFPIVILLFLKSIAPVKLAIEGLMRAGCVEQCESSRQLLFSAVDAFKWIGILSALFLISCAVMEVVSNRKALVAWLTLGLNLIALIGAVVLTW